jgi:phosphatidylserine/phosphatidylglycerophosphate/cardiolipin synthase-like enzyme
MDGRLAFAGGMDFASARWDRRRHAVDEPHRHNALGLSSAPHHDVQAAVTGPAVAAFVEIFREAWQAHVGESLELEVPEHGVDGWSLHEVIDSPALPLPEGPVEITVTRPPSESTPPATGVCGMYARLIASAERLIYVETQYFTSSIVCDALLARMKDRTKPQLTLVMLLPDGAESGKERLVLGDQQQRQLAMLREVAGERGHQVKVLCSSACTDGGDEVTTYIHSKLMIVDDRAVTIGSANLTNRSMGFDSELNLTWATDAVDGADARIRALRTSLLAEHAGVVDGQQFDDPEGLAARLDALVADPGSKLRHAPTWEVDAEEEPVLAAVFDPGCEPAAAAPSERGPSDEVKPPRRVAGLWRRLWRVIRHPRWSRAESGGH